MNTAEERLRDALEARARTVHPETLRPLPDPVPVPARPASPATGPARPVPRRHRGWLVPLAAAAAIVLVAALSLLLPGRTGHAPPTAPRPAAMPRYFVLYRAMPGGNGPHPGDAVLEVRDTATGRIHDTFDLTQKSGVHGAVPSSLAAAADHRTFFVQYGLWDRKTHLTAGARIYRFQITGSGHIVGFTSITSVPAGTRLPTAMAVSPDGSKLALADNYQLSRPEVMVVNLATGAVTRWRGGLPGQQYANAIVQLSWAGDGHTLAFLYRHSMSAPTAPSAGYSQWTTEFRTLDADTPGGSLTAGRLILHWAPSVSRVPGQAVISPDGRSITVALQQGPIYKYSGMPANVEVQQISIRNGRQLRVLYVGPAGNSTSPFLRGDGAGHWLLTANWKLGWISGGRMHDLPPGQDGTVADVAW